MIDASAASDERRVWACHLGGAATAKPHGGREIIRGLLALLLCACGSEAGPDLTLAVRVPTSIDSQRLLASVATVTLRAERDGRVLAQAQAEASASRVNLGGVPFGPRTEFILEGLAISGDVIARGRSCPINFERGGPPVPLYFSPTNFFADTVGPPAVARADAVALPLADGTVLLVGGARPDGTSLDSAALYGTPTATFADAPGQHLSVARTAAALAVVPAQGAVVVGGLDAMGRPLDNADVFDFTTRTFSLLQGQQLGARVGHRVVALADTDQRLLVVGGSDPSTALINLRSEGAKIEAGPPLPDARREPAVVVAVGIPLVFGGYNPAGLPTRSIYAVETPLPTSSPSLLYPRAEATATLLDDGAILVVGGVFDPIGQRMCDAELYNPISQTTTCLPLGTPRRGHTATALDQGRVLVIGGLGDADGQPLASVELYVPASGFVSERSLGKPRRGHVAVPLCDRTVLVAGGDADGRPSAEIYAPR